MKNEERTQVMVVQCNFRLERGKFLDTVLGTKIETVIQPVFNKNTNRDKLLYQ